MTPRSVWTAALVLTGGLVVVAPAEAQQDNACQRNLAQATQLYDQGQFDEVIRATNICVGLDSESRRIPTSSTRVQKVRAYTLRAQSQIAEPSEENRRDAEDSVEALIRNSPEFLPAPGAPPLFVEMVQEAKRQLSSSASKVPEDPREAPATIVLVTADQIERRGYADLEAVLHDLPGFDISRGNGDLYSNIYQRGYRSNATDRTLLLVDGVEQNDLHSNIVYLSRQYPLSNVSRIEVVYGPASITYGPNAFSGVINIVTLEAEDLINDNERFNGRLRIGGGSFATGSVDGTVGGVHEVTDFRWTVTARGFRSDEQDLSELPRPSNWSAGIPVFEDPKRVNYAQLLALPRDTLNRYLCKEFDGGDDTNFWDAPDECDEAHRNGSTRGALDKLLKTKGWITEVKDEDGRTTALVPTAEGIAAARRLDLALWQDRLRALDNQYRDPTRDAYLSGKVRFADDLVVGGQLWRRSEGTSPWYRDSTRGPGGTWVPRQANFFLRYARPLRDNLSIDVRAHYKNDQLDDESVQPLALTYASGFLDLVDLSSNKEARFATFRFSQVSSQIRAEATAIYRPSDTFNAFAGVEIRDGSIQASYFIDPVATGNKVGLDDDLIVTTDRTPEEVKVSDFGVFGQASWTLGRTVRTVVGLRYDENIVRENEQVSLRDFATRTFNSQDVRDFGGFASPRAAAVATLGRDHGVALTAIPGRLFVKGIYSRSSHQPSNLQRFAVEPAFREFASPSLGREETTNYEVATIWEPTSSTRFDVTHYWVDYSDVLHTAIKIQPCECTPRRTGQFDSIGNVAVEGWHLMASHDISEHAVYANYTNTRATRPDIDKFGKLTGLEPRSMDDIAHHRFNVGGTLRRWDRLSVHARMNYVGERPTIGGTSLADDLVDGYLTAHATIGFRLSTMTFQLVLNNLFDATYDHPGVGSVTSGEDSGFAPLLRQPGRTAYIRLIVDPSAFSAWGR